MRYLIHLTCLIVVSSAHADDAVKLHLDEGTKLYNNQRYAEAAEEYLAAYELAHEPVYLYAIAQSQRLAGDCAKAVQTYRAYLGTQPTADERAKAERNIERCTATARERGVTAQLADIAMPAPLPRPPEPEPDRAPRPTKSYLVGHILVGAGVLAIGGGAYLYRKGHDAIEAHNDAVTYDEFVAARDGIDHARRQQTIGVSALAAGGALALGGIVFYVVRARAPVENGVSAQLTPGRALVTLSRSF
jgi:hypothetical protein